MYINHQNTICIEAGWLVSEGIISKSLYDSFLNRKKIQRVRRASYQCPALIAFESLPQFYREAVEAKIGGYKTPSNSILSTNCVPDPLAKNFFSEYRLPDGRYLPLEKQLEYSNNAMLLNAIQSTYNTYVTTRKKCGGSTAPAWEQVLRDLKTINHIHHTLGSSRRLRDKLNRYKKEGYACLIPKSWMNKSATKVKDTEQEAILRQLLRYHNNLDNVQVASLYNETAQTQGWRSISDITVGNYRKKWKLLTVSGSRGSGELMNFHAMQVKRKAPSLPLYYWTMDGWDAELLYQTTTTNKKGHSITTYHNNANIVVVLDPFNKYPVGYAIGTHENPALIKEALRNAVMHTSELFGKMHKVLQLQTDNYGKGALTPFYQAVTQAYTPAKAHNAKAKAIEPWFKYLNKTYCQLLPNWSGFGVTAKKSSQPNAEFLNKTRKNIPTYEELCATLSGIIDKERNRLKAQYLEGYKALPAEDKHLMSYEDYLFTLGERTGYTNRLSHNGLNITIDRKALSYDSFDIRFRELAHVEWTIAYDPKDLSHVLATSADGALRFVLEEKHIQPMALKERTQDDLKKLRRIEKYNTNLIETIVDSVTDDAQTVQELFIKNPELNSVTAKLLITDSQGQHKNQKYLEQKEKIKHLAEKSEFKVQKQEEKSKYLEHDEYYKNKVDLSQYITTN